jgi:very-short-patch-repair endonuclease
VLRYQSVVDDQTLPADEDELGWLLFRQCGVISRRQALVFLTPTVLLRRVATGPWRVAHRGVFVAHTGPLSDEQRQWIAVLAAGAGHPAYLGGLSALIGLGLRAFTAPRIDVVLPARRRDHDPPPGVVVHRTTRLPAADLSSASPLPCTSAPRSVVDAAAWAASDSQARAIVAASFQQRLVGGDEVERVVARLPRSRRRALVLATARDAAGGSHALAEIDLLTLCRRAGLPLPSRQVQRRDATGRLRFLDAYWADWGVHAEVDGAHHMDVQQWWADMRRHNDLWIAGDRQLRFPAWLVREHSAEVATQIRAALLAAGWQP